MMMRDSYGCIPSMGTWIFRGSMAALIPMNRQLAVVLVAAIAAFSSIGCRSSKSFVAASLPDIPVTIPPESFFQIVRESDREAARQFYGKHLSVLGISVAAHAGVADAALQRTHWLVTHMLAGRPDIAQAMASNGMYLIIIGKDQVYTDMPEYRNSPNPEYQNERVRGTGGKPTSFGEENLLCLPLDRYDDESIGLHEFCHTIDGTLRSIDPTWNQRRNATYRNAIEKGRWKDVYAGSNPGEYWAEICQAYFDCNRVNNWNHNHIGTREQLQAYDPEGYELVRTVFHLNASNDWRYTFLRKQPSVISPPARFGIDPFYTKFTWAREFPVIGRGASDEALLRANDTIRKVFAYRHDVLKALIAADLKLVVLGKDERLSDLPEFSRLRSMLRINGGAQELDYVPEVRLLVVPEENILRSAEGGADCEVIRQMARAVYFHTCLRPVDPNWNNRGRNVQQYELRVKRLDERLDARLKELHAAARAKGVLKGTAAAEDPVEYWSRGWLAYFDAAGGGHVNTREALQTHDPELHALMHETMAYEGRQDWRLARRKAAGQISATPATP